MDQRFSLRELADAVNRWCEQHRVAPLNGQAGEEVTERNIRYYRAIGLVDAPESGGGQGFTEKHRLQLIAIRILQANGLPLRKIRELLFGRSLRELLEIQTRGLRERERQPSLRIAAGAEELWRTVPLDDDFLIISRRGTVLSQEQRAAIVSIINTGKLGGEPANHDNNEEAEKP